jgi:hypothetical protein
MMHRVVIIISMPKLSLPAGSLPYARTHNRPLIRMLTNTTMVLTALLGAGTLHNCDSLLEYWQVVKMLE